MKQVKGLECNQRASRSRRVLRSLSSEAILHSSDVLTLRCAGEALFLLGLTLKGATMVAATGFLAEAAAGSDPADTAGSTGTAQTLGRVMANGIANHHSNSEWGVLLGNEFEVVTDEDAYATIEAAWNAGVRYYDTARGAGWVWLSAATVTSFITRSGANMSFPRSSRFSRPLVAPVLGSFISSTVAKLQT
jgi:hypothetical protein